VTERKSPASCAERRHHPRDAAFRQGGREAIDKVMRTQPAVFLKLLVLLVPRQMTLDTAGGIKAMTDEQLERGIELVKEMLAQREAGANAKVIEETNLIFVLPPNVYVDPSGRGLFGFKFSSRPHPWKFGRKTISGGEGRFWRGSGIWRRDRAHLVDGCSSLLP